MLAANVVYRALNVTILFAVNILLSRLAGVTGYGVLSLLVANATIFNLLSGFGIDSAITFHTASGKINVAKLVGFLSGVVFFQLLLLIIVELAVWLSTGHGWLLRSDMSDACWGIALVIAISLIEKYSALLIGRQLFTLFNRCVLLANGLLLAAIIILYANGTIDLLWVIRVYILFQLLQAIFLMIAFHYFDQHDLQLAIPGRSDWKLFFSYSLLAFIINLIQFLAYRVDYWILDHYRGERELGWYSAAVKLAQFFWILPLLFASIILPKVADQKQPMEDHKMQALVRGMNGINIIIGLILFFSSQFLVPLLFGKLYAESAILFNILLPGVILFCIATMLASWFAGHNKLRVNLGGSLICLLVIAALDLWLIPIKGMKGAAMASSIGYAVTAIYFMIVYCLMAKVNPAKLFLPEPKDGKYIMGIFRFIFSKR
jgi:O-antigen/teichoic acid export membrane protein